MSRRRLPPIACLAVAALAACSGAGGDVMPTGTLPLPLVAHGNEPFWWLRLDVGAVAFGTLGDERTFDASVDGAVQRRDDGALVCRVASGGEQLDATLLPRIEVDTMTGMPHPYSATVRVYGREWRGVGGDPGDLLRGFPWVVLQIADQQFSASVRPTLEFRRDGGLVLASASGVTTGRWHVGGEALRLSGFDALPPPLREALSGVSAFSISAGGELVLRGDGGVALRAVRQRS